MLTKRIVVAGLGLLLFAGFVYGDVPRLLNYQGRLTDTAGNPLTGTYSITFSIYTTATGGSALWSETHNSVSVSVGLFNVLLGSVNTLNLAFDTDYYLGIKVGSDAEMTPRQRIASAGYAINADMVDGLHSTDFSLSGIINSAGNPVDWTKLKSVPTGFSDGIDNTGDVLTQNSVGSYHIIDSTITDADISATANISPSKVSGTAWTSTNDGSGSGLDADTVDGSHASTFASVAHTHPTFTKIAQNDTPVNTTNTSFTDLQSVSIPANSVTSFILVFAHFQLTGRSDDGTNESIGQSQVLAGSTVINRISGGGYLLVHEYAATTLHKIEVGEYTLVGFYEPTAGEKASGFTVKTQGRIATGGTPAYVGFCNSVRLLVLGL